MWPPCANFKRLALSTLEKGGKEESVWEQLAICPFLKVRETIFLISLSPSEQFAKGKIFYVLHLFIQLRSNKSFKSVWHFHVILTSQQYLTFLPYLQCPKQALFWSVDIITTSSLQVVNTLIFYCGQNKKGITKFNILTISKFTVWQH